MTGKGEWVVWVGFGGLLGFFFQWWIEGTGWNVTSPLHWMVQAVFGNVVMLSEFLLYLIYHFYYCVYFVIYAEAWHYVTELIPLVSLKIELLLPVEAIAEKDNCLFIFVTFYLCNLLFSKNLGLTIPEIKLFHLLQSVLLILSPCTALPSLPCLFLQNS